MKVLCMRLPKLVSVVLFLFSISLNAQTVPPGYILYATGELRLFDRAVSESSGLLGAGADIFIGHDSRLQNSLTARGSITLYDRTVIEENATAGQSVARINGAEVLGQITENAQLLAYTIPYQCNTGN